MIDQLISSNGFWFALGILAGLMVDLFARVGYEWWNRPILTSPQSDEDWLRPFRIKVSDYALNLGFSKEKKRNYRYGD